MLIMDLMMSSVTCAGCGLKIDSKESACMQCGAKPPSKPPAGIIIAAIIGSFIVLVNLLSFVFSEPTSAASVASVAAPPTKPPADPAHEARVKQALVTATLIKTALRDPDSLTWKHIWVSEDSSVVCLEYRARNGFGGLNLESAVYAEGRLSNAAAAWNKNCVGPAFHDMTYVRHSL